LRSEQSHTCNEQEAQKQKDKSGTRSGEKSAVRAAHRDVLLLTYVLMLRCALMLTVEAVHLLSDKCGRGCVVKSSGVIVEWL
jgi:hypothetical protein